MSLPEFVTLFKVLHERWGYSWDTDPNYENKTNGDLRQFQHLTDYIMRFLSRNGNTFDEDVRTMFGVTFYIPRSDFNVTDNALTKYLKECGPYFKANRKLCKQAYDYVKTCPPSSTRCILQVSLKWMRMVRKYYIRYRKQKKNKISSFTKLIKATAISECRAYIEESFGDTLNARSVKDAIRQVQEYDVDTSSGTSDYTSEEEDTAGATGLTGTQLRL